MKDPDGWQKSAMSAVEHSISQLLDEFRRDPFTHRCEHSLHIDLYQILLKHPPLSARYEIGSTAFTTRLVHKEWPSTKVFSLSGQKKPKRQSYDLGVLSPAVLDGLLADDFSRGTPAATFVIELGLNYGFEHLLGDINKLKHNEVEHGYIVHLSRVRTSQSKRIEDLIRDTSAKTNIKTAFAHLDVPKRTWVCKTLSGNTFDESAHTDG